MGWYSRTCGVIFFLAFSIWGGSAVPAAGIDGRMKSPSERQADGRQLIRDGRYQAAISTAGQWSGPLRRELLAQVERANHEKERPKAISLYRNYFRYFPFGHFYWHSDWQQWDAAATEYVKLRQVQQEPLDRALDDDAAALEIYRTLAEHHKKYDRENCARLADEIFEKHPRSIFAPAAALTVAHCARMRGADDETVGIYEKYLTALRESGAPERGVILLLLSQADCYSRSTGEPELLCRGLKVYQAIGEITEIDYEMRFCLLRSAQLALEIGDPVSLGLSRKLFRRFLEKYPGVVEAREASKGIVETYLKVEQMAEADVALRELEELASEGTEFSNELFAIAQAHFKAADYEEALSYLQEVVRRFPQSATAPRAYLGMGEVYEKTGDEEKSVAAYRKAAGLSRSPTATSIMDASDTHNRASQWLARYYMDKKDWDEALRWWTNWKPSSWCGTCLGSMETRRAENMAICLAHLGRHREAAETCLEFLFQHATVWAESSPVALLVARLYSEADQWDDLLRIVTDYEERQLREFDQKGYFKGESRQQKVNHLPTRPFHEIAEIRELASKGDVDALIAICRKTSRSSADIFADPGRDWLCREAAEALADLGSRGVDTLDWLVNSRTNCGSWPIYALGKSPSPKALDALGRRAETEQTRNADNVACAIAMHGADGRRLLIGIAAKTGRYEAYNMVRAAERWLEKPSADPVVLMLPWPRPKPGSLPVTLGAP